MPELQLPYTEPMDLGATLGFLAARAVAGVEAYDEGQFGRVLSAPGGPALVVLSAGDGHVRCRIRLTDPADLRWVTTRARRLLDLDADPTVIDAALGRDPVLGPLVLKRPGLRSPGAVDGFEVALRAVIGQQVSVAGARTVLGRIVQEYGTVAFPGEPWFVFPTPERLAMVEPDALPMPRARGRTVVTLARACAEGTLELTPDADPAEQRRRLLAVPGVGPWTAGYVAMRALAEPDVLLTGDLGLIRSAHALGLDLSGGRPDWAPWRSYATHHLWAAY